MTDGDIGEFPDILTALETAQATGRLTVETMQAIARELHRLHDAYRALVLSYAAQAAATLDTPPTP